MDKTEAKEATAAIGMMLKAFPSSQSTMSADSPKVYLFAVEEFSLDAIKRACRLFVRGEIKGRNNAFAPVGAGTGGCLQDFGTEEAAACH